MLEEQKKKTRWIKSGDPVVHITNLEFIYTVEKLIFQSKEINTSEGKKKVSRIRGVQCKFYDDKGVLHSELMHSKELIPHKIAQKGPLEACKFVNREGEYKDY